MGLPASGKSTLVETIPLLRVVSPDQIREELTGRKGDQSRNDEVFEVAHNTLALYLEANQSVLFDATNVTASARQMLLGISKDVGAETRLIILRTPFAECKARNAERNEPVPDDVMDRMHFNFARSLAEVAFETWDQIVNYWMGWK